jgi:hypothetical protein
MYVENSKIPIPDLTSEEEEETREQETVRPSTSNRKPPKYLDDYAVLALNAESFVDDALECYKDIKNREYKEKWYQAVEEELNSISENKTWTYTELPPGRQAIASEWVFKLKKDQDGNIERYKARAMIKGCFQRKGFDYEETFWVGFKCV